jgi:uncharacterized protein YdhG (YjbR/CyaY superfamily)
MAGGSGSPDSGKAGVDAYIAGFPAEVQAILQEVRATIRAAAPDADEIISYRMPAYRQGGVLVYFGGFNHHVGLYPPVGDPELAREAAPYAGEKGNLRFPYDQPIPHDLIRRIVAHRAAQQRPRRPRRA